MIIYRVGEGQTSSDKILDKGTQWYEELDLAMKYAKETHRNIYISKNKSKYQLYYEYAN